MASATVDSCMSKRATFIPRAFICHESVSVLATTCEPSGRRTAGVVIGGTAGALGEGLPQPHNKATTHENVTGTTAAVVSRWLTTDLEAKEADPIGTADPNSTKAIEANLAQIVF